MMNEEDIRPFVGWLSGQSSTISHCVLSSFQSIASPKQPDQCRCDHLFVLSLSLYCTACEYAVVFPRQLCFHFYGDIVESSIY